MKAVLRCKNIYIVGKTDVEKKRKRVKRKLFYHIFLYFKYCYQSNLNGLYMNDKIDNKAMVWAHWKNKNESLQRSEVKIRPKDF